jgi:hypothetical protein
LVAHVCLFFSIIFVSSTLRSGQFKEGEANNESDNWPTYFLLIGIAILLLVYLFILIIMSFACIVLPKNIVTRGVVNF